MDIVIILIVLLLLFGGGGGLYWGMGAGWGIGPIGLIVVALVVAYLMYGYRGRRGGGLEARWAEKRRLETRNATIAASAPAPSVHANAYPTDAGRPKTWSV